MVQEKRKKSPGRKPSAINYDVVVTRTRLAGNYANPEHPPSPEGDGWQPYSSSILPGGSEAALITFWRRDQRLR